LAGAESNSAILDNHCDACPFWSRNIEATIGIIRYKY